MEGRSGPNGEAGREAAAMRRLEEAFFLHDDLDQPQSFELACGEAACFTDRCPGKESPNEDAAALIPAGDEKAVFAVADGMGGSPAGERAARLTISALAAAVAESIETGSPLRAAILNGIEAANRAVQEMGVGAGSTVAVVEIDGARARAYHVGDSVILVVGQRGKIKQQTVAHSPVGFAVAAGVLGEVEALGHEDRHLVSNYIGAADMRIEIGSAFDLAPRDTLLLASDGLADNLGVEEIVDRIRRGSLGQAAERLAHDARGRMLASGGPAPSKPDDLTFVLFRRGAR